MPVLQSTKQLANSVTLTRFLGIWAPMSCLCEDSAFKTSTVRQTLLGAHYINPSHVYRVFGTQNVRRHGAGALAGTSSFPPDAPSLA